jgi:hypothetical protein
MLGDFINLFTSNHLIGLDAALVDTRLTVVLNVQADNR